MFILTIMKLSHEIFLNADVLMQFIAIAGCPGISIKLIDITTNCKISLREDEALKLIRQIKQMDDINICHPADICRTLHCDAFYIRRHLYTSRLSIVAAAKTKYAESIALDDQAILNLSMMEKEFENIIQMFQLKN